MAVRISEPPMVGVPFFTKCVCGPSWRTAWPTFSAVSLRMAQGPKSSENASEVSAAITARKVV